MSSIGPAIEIAMMDMPRMYGARRKLSLRERITGRLFARPGPKPFKKEITYRGKQPPSQLKQTLDQIGEYREEPVSLDTLDVMRHHPMVKLGTIVRASPILTALREARVKCDDKKIASFIKTVLVDEWLLRIAETAIMPSYSFGCAPHEKVWENRHVRSVYTDDDGNEIVAWDGMASVYKKVKFVHPMTIDRFLTQKDSQDFAGFVQVPRPGEEERPVEAWKAFHYVNRFIHGGLWGESEYRDVYPYWYYSEFFRALLADYLRYKAVPPIIGYAPVGVREDQDGNEVDLMVHTGEILQAAYDNLVVVLPDERDDSGNRRFGYEELRVSERAEIFARALEDLDVLILRGLIVPERTVTQDRAAVGSYNQANIHQERMLDAAKMELDNFLRACNLWLVPQLIEDNFGPEAPPCQIFVHTVSEELKSKLHSVIVTILQNDRFGVFASQVAFRELLEFVNIPFTTDKNGVPIPQMPDEKKKDEDSE